MKIAKYILGAILISGISNAATVVVTQGFGATQGITVTQDGVALPSFTVAVGATLDGSFAVFGTPIIDTGKVNAAGIVATGPASFNAQVINLWVGNGVFGAPTTEFVLLRTNANTAFPADVSGTGASTFNAALGSGLTLIGKSANAVWNPTGTPTQGGNINFVVIPEPSTMLLGALGALGLLRRRR